MDATDTPSPSPPASPVVAVRRDPPKARVRVISAAHERASSEAAPASKQKDPFTGHYGQHGIVEPPYSYETIAWLLDESDVLQAALDATVTNIADFGLQFVPITQSLHASERDALDAERRRLSVWFDHAGSPGMSFSAVRALVRFDLGLFGDGYYEVLRDGKGRLAGVEHAQTRWMRKTRRDREAVEADEWIRTEDGSFTKRKAMRRFRKYVQCTSDGQFTWFKEFGDPRPIRADTGEVDERARTSDLANEVICLSHYGAAEHYGRPRWRGAANSIKGRARAGGVNVDVFENRGIPPLLITVQGAPFDQKAVERVADHFDAAKGSERWHAPLILEALTPTSDDPADPAGMSRPGAIPKIEVHDLSKALDKDALFMGYRAACASDVGMSLRMPPIYLGISKEYNFATAQAARQVAEEQVFAPERAREDAIINALLLPELDARWCKVVTKGPPLLTEDVLLKLIAAGVSAGALTVNNVADLLEPMLGIELSTPAQWRSVPAVVFQALAKSNLLPGDVSKALGDVVRVGGAATGDGSMPPAEGDGSVTNDPAQTSDGTDAGATTESGADAGAGDGAEADGTASATAMR